MKVLLQNHETGQFLKGEGLWTSDDKQATDFGNPLNAMNFCFLHHLEGTSLVLRMEGREYEMPVRCEE